MNNLKQSALQMKEALKQIELGMDQKNKQKYEEYLYQHDLTPENLEFTHVLFYSDLTEIKDHAINTLFDSVEEKMKYLTNVYKAENQDFTELFDQEIENFGGLEVCIIGSKFESILNYMVARVLREKADYIDVSPQSQNRNTLYEDLATIMVDSVVENNDKDTIMLNTLDAYRLMDLATYMVQSVKNGVCADNEQYLNLVNRIMEHTFDHFDIKSNLEETERSIPLLKSLNDLQNVFENGKRQPLNDNDREAYLFIHDLVVTKNEQYTNKMFEILEETDNLPRGDETVFNLLPLLKKEYDSIVHDGYVGTYQSFPDGIIATQEFQVFPLTNKFSILCTGSDSSFEKLGTTQNIEKEAKEESLNSLFNDNDYYSTEEKEALLSNLDTHPLVLKFFAHESAPLGIRLIIASHPNSPKEALKDLVTDQNKYVALAAMDNLQIQIPDFKSEILLEQQKVESIEKKKNTDELYDFCDVDEVAVKAANQPQER